MERLDVAEDAGTALDRPAIGSHRVGVLLDRGARNDGEIESRAADVWFAPAVERQTDRFETVAHDVDQLLDTSMVGVRDGEVVAGVAGVLVVRRAFVGAGVVYRSHRRSE